MDSGFYWYAFKRFALVSGLVIFFCLLPGPRALIGSQLDYLFQQQSVESISYGIHLSLVHFCWLFGFEMPPFEYPEHLEPLLASLAVFVSAAIQLAVLITLIGFWRWGLNAYYLHRAAMDELAEFGPDVPEPVDDDTLVITPPNLPLRVGKVESEQQPNKRTDVHKARIDIARVEGVEIQQPQRLAK